LTLVVRQAPSLRWDLGEARGTVAVRMPLHPVAVELLGRTGPMAVSSANISGSPAATTTDEAVNQLGGSVDVYLDGGPCRAAVGSTIVDCTRAVPRVLRVGAVDVTALRTVLPSIEEPVAS
jgi:tRNA threonylcarbamoyl adenosine modification protein (Sua5/YciO/YrdC/YwlC family)